MTSTYLTTTFDMQQQNRGQESVEQTLTLSDEAYEQAAACGLGNPVSEYPSLAEKANMGNVMRGIRLAFIFAWLLIVAVCLGLATLLYMLTGPSSYPFDWQDSFFHLLAPCLFLFAALMHTIFMLRAMRLLLKKLVVCTGGMLILRGKRLEASTWEQITAIRLDVTHMQNRFYSSGPVLAYRIKRSNGSALTLDNTKGAQVEERYIAARTPALLARYESGAPLMLGKLCLTPTGITWRRRTLSWHEYAEVRIMQDPSRLHIFQQERARAWAILRPRDVPSLALAGKVIERIQSGQLAE
jgi:hypothetical protein